jgi:hypothetical protein
VVVVDEHPALTLPTILATLNSEVREAAAFDRINKNKGNETERINRYGGDWKAHPVVLRWWWWW